MTTFPTPPARRPGGFTLLELVIAIGLLALLMGSVFMTASQNIQLGNGVVRKQNEVSEQTAFFALMNEQFTRLPGNARLELTYEDAGQQYLSDLTIQNVPMTFTWGGAERVAKAVRLSTVRRRDGLLDIVLSYYENEILDETSGIGASSGGVLDDKPFAEVVLLEDVYAFEWRVLDGRTMEWDFEWDLVGRLPLQLELVLKRNQAADPVRQIFWLTPKQNPEVMMRQLQAQGRAGQVGATAPGAGRNRGGDGDPDSVPTVEINPPPAGGQRGGGR